MIGDSGQADEVERVNLVIRSDLKGGDGTEGSLAARLHVTPPSPPITPPWLHVTPHPPILLTELQKRADRADQSVLFFLLIFLGGKLVGANFYFFCNCEIRWVY